MIFAVVLTVIVLFAQAVFLPLNLTVFALIVWTTVVKERYWPLVAFLLGLSFDFLTAQPLGLSAVVFLGLIFFIWVYSKKWQISNPVFLFFTAVAADMLTRAVWGIDNSYLENIFLGLLTAAWGWWRQRKEEPVKVKLKSV